MKCAGEVQSGTSQVHVLEIVSTVAWPLVNDIYHAENGKECRTHVARLLLSFRFESETSQEVFRLTLCDHAQLTLLRYEYGTDYDFGSAPRL